MDRDDIDEEAVRRLFNMHYRTIEQARQNYSMS